MNDFTISTGDCLAGGGGVTYAMKQIPGLDVKWVLNHDPIAIRTNVFNNKGPKYYWTDFYKQDEHDIEPVDFIWLSIECTQHSLANGGREKKIGSYMLGWEAVRFIKYMQPYLIGIENVPEFKNWAPLDENGHPDKEKKGLEFEKWKNTICSQGYEYSEKIMNAADYGIPTRRVRYFAFFVRSDINLDITWPDQTHSKTGENGLKKWVPCKNYIDLANEGESIFGREFNPNIRKNKRNPLSVNTLKRIAGGIKKYAPDLYFIMHYYGQGCQYQHLNKPLNTIPTNDRHALIKLEKIHFIQDHCRTDNYNLVNDPLNPILAWQTKQLITIDKKQFISKYFSGNHHNASSLNTPLSTITTIDHNYLVSTKFISKQYNSNGNPEANNQSINDPAGTITTDEKMQFISAYFSSGNKPGSQNFSVNDPLNTILTGTNKDALITAIKKGEIDFDIKMRFLTPDELSRISTFPEKYFSNPLLKLTRKQQVKLIGNAVPPEWAKMIIEPVIQKLRKALINKKIAV